jgi:tetratricopeptide (TPR) repeat protein
MILFASTSSQHQPALGEVPASGPVDWMRLLPAFLILAGVIVYLSSLSGAFVFDDGHVLLSVRKAVDAGRPMDVLHGRRWFFNLTFLANYLIDSEEPTNPVLYHLVNLVIHLTAGLVLFGIVRRTLLLRGDATLAQSNRAAALGFAIALLWLVHPLNTQAVTYIVQRLESMMGMFYLLTVYNLLRCATSGRSKARFGWGAGAVACCTLGMVTKEVMVTAPIVALLFDRMFISRTFGQALRQRWALYVGLALSWLTIIVAGGYSIFSAKSSAGFAMDVIGPWDYLVSQGEVILHYLGMSFWPHPLVLDYQGSWVPAFIREPRGPQQWLPSSLVILALVLISFIGTARGKWWGFCGTWFFVILGPTSSFMPIADLMFEHRMYLSLIAVMALVVIGGDALLGRVLKPAAGQRVGAVLVLMAAAALGATTIQRNGEYASAVSIWLTVTERAPHGARGWHNLASALNKVGQYDEAMYCYEKVLERVPTYAAAHSGIGDIYRKRGNIAEAINKFQRAVELEPEDAAYQYNLGLAYLNKDDRVLATEQFHKAIKLNPQHAKAHSNLGVIAMRQGKMDEAGLYFHKAVEHDIRLAQAWVSLGQWYNEQKQFASAIECLTTAVQLDDAQAEAHNNLGQAYAMSRRLDEALESFLYALELDPHYLQALSNLTVLAKLHADAGGFAQAVAVMELAIDAASTSGVDDANIQPLIKRISQYRQGQTGEPSPPDGD